jgi:osmoprotectant transport system ATP-binding protein
MLELRGVTKSYHGKTILHPVDLDIPAGSTVVLIGASGCGKSTLLRIVAGLVQQDAGEIRFEGQLMTEKNKNILRRRLGYVIQDAGLFPHLSARENVGIVAKFLKWPADKIQARVDELVSLARFPAEAMDRFPAQLSGGQRQRLGIMRALMLDPPLILMDEPLGALDPMVRYDLQEDLKNIFQTLKKSVLLVTHDMGEAGFFGDQVLLLGDGLVVQRGNLDDLINRPATEYVSKFIRAQRLPRVA